METRQYQVTIRSKTLDLFKAGEITRIMAESPTGSGKTYIGLSTAQELSDHLGGKLIVVWVAMRKNLLKQVMREAAKAEILCDIRPLSMFNADGALELRREADLDGKKILIVLDESHHDGCSSMETLHSRLKADWTLGLSATPQRQDNIKTCFEKTIRDAGINRLMEEGYLSRYDQFMIEDWKPETVARHYLSDPDRWGKSIFYFLSLKECGELSSLLTEADVPHHLVTGGDKELESKIRDFESGAVKVLVNCMVLTEGFDAPSIKTAWVRPSSRIPTIQMSGRAFRIHEETPIKQVVQSRDTKWPIERTCRPKERFVYRHGTFLSVASNERLEEIAIESIQKSLENWEPLPEFIGTGKKVKKITVGRRG